MRTFALTFFLLVSLMLSGCVGADDAKASLISAGYTNVTITGYDFWLCSGYQYSASFTATGPTGVPASGAVCSNVGRGNKIVLD